MNKIIGTILCSLSVFACGDGYNGELFDYPQDGGIGGLEQGLGTKFSSTYTHGVSLNAKRSACTVANGGGVNGITYYHCMLPGTTSITYQVTGTDPYVCPGPLCDAQNNLSYKSETQTARSRVNAILDQSVSSNPWTFTQVTVQPATVTITSGDCSGDPMTSDNIQTFVCTSFGSTSTVTESLTGIYKRWNTGMVIKVDIAAIEQRTNNNADFHQLLEHGMHAAWFQVVGIGTRDEQPAYWNDGRVFIPNPGYHLGDFDTHNMAAGDACRAANYSSASQSTFAALSGSCANN